MTAYRNMVAAMADRIAALEAELLWYADTFCEHGKNSEVCGRLGGDQCSGCKARALLAKSTPDPLATRFEIEATRMEDDA